MAAFPPWLHMLAIASLALAFSSAIVIALDELRRPQKMRIMYVVWPLTALFGSVIWLGAYYKWGRGPADGDFDRQAKPPFAAMVVKGASHCGAGCTLGDIVAEWTAFAVPAVAVWFGYGSLFANRTFAIWIPDFLLAFLFGIVFQYFTIKPMRDLSVGQGIWQAIKADIASISSWQIGMYGVMAIIQFLIFLPVFGGVAEVNSPEFWFAMQAAMIAGFATAYPVNWLLIRAGVKEAM
ncbi:DUF4396 domain-containing protein [Sphingomonas sp. GC_Shp_3]|uniref:DUF4396 domain-containing protein n=1 Tax=Sphingomonas sp. GC_Shp_3 TaxID=2937383 RepID=UPI00226A9BA1|nr:DUF4396 domain-containing protein [Sphingomonas sp. GC_Shp_3]